MLKREWGEESNGNLPHLFTSSKTATLVPEFVAEDLPLGMALMMMMTMMMIRNLGMYIYFNSCCQVCCKSIFTVQFNYRQINYNIISKTFD